MSVTLKLNDKDAELVGKVLAAVGKEVNWVRVNVRAEGDFQKNALGVKVWPTVTAPYGTADELIRIAAAFDTAVYANESGKR